MQNTGINEICVDGLFELKIRTFLLQPAMCVKANTLFGVITNGLELFRLFHYFILLIIKDRERYITRGLLTNIISRTIHKLIENVVSGSGNTQNSANQ